MFRIHPEIHLFDQLHARDNCVSRFTATRANWIPKSKCCRTWTTKKTRLSVTDGYPCTARRQYICCSCSMSACSHAATVNVIGLCGKIRWCTSVVGQLDSVLSLLPAHAYIELYFSSTLVPERMECATIRFSVIYVGVRVWAFRRGGRMGWNIWQPDRNRSSRCGRRAPGGRWHFGAVRMVCKDIEHTHENESHPRSGSVSFGRYYILNERAECGTVHIFTYAVSGVNYVTDSVQPRWHKLSICANTARSIIIN